MIPPLFYTVINLYLAFMYISNNSCHYMYNVIFFITCILYTSLKMLLNFVNTITVGMHMFIFSRSQCIL
jgi:hypothetical protein